MADTDEIPGLLTATLVGQAQNGTVTLNTDGSFIYQPNTGYVGLDSFVYRASDRIIDSNPATVNLTVVAVNNPPVANPDTYTFRANDTLSISPAGVLTNDSDLDGQPLSASLVQQATHGTVTLASDGGFVYLPNSNFVGTDTFVYSASDGITSTAATVAFNVTNSTPAVVNDTYTLAANRSLNVAVNGVLGNDSDPDGNTLTVGLVNQATSGTVTLNPDGSFVYQPNSNFVGTDTFVYQAGDRIASTPGTVILAVTNQAPLVANNAYTATRNQTLTIATAAGVLSDDSDPEGIGLSAAIATAPSNGSLTLNADGSFIYQPRAGFAGSDTFTYRASDGITFTTGTVSLTVAAGVNSTPVANADSFTLRANDTLNVGVVNSILNNDSDADADPLAVSVVTNVTHGNLSVNVTDGSFRYIPTSGFVGTDTFVYQVNDGLVNSNLATVTLNVITNTAPTANPDSGYRAAVNGTLVVDALNGVLSNDSDGENNPLTAIVASSTTNGNLSLNPNGSFTYIPTAGFSGSDTFVYQANDGQLNSNPVTVPITVVPNTAPIANADGPYLATSNGTLTIGQAISGLLLNDTDADNNPLTAILVGQAVHGTATVNPDGTFRYIPTAGYAGVDSFTYKANDGISDSAPAVVSLSVVANVPPTANPDSYRTKPDTQLIVTSPTLLSNDTDPDSATLRVDVVDSPANGVLLAFSNLTGTFTYQPNTGFTGVDSFTYRANDGINDSNLATAFITVSPNSAPVAAIDSYSTNRNATLSATLGVLSNDTDIDLDPLTAEKLTDPQHGSLQFNSNGTFVYTPTTGYTGADSFTYRAGDGSLFSSPTVVALTVLNSSSPPVANNDTTYTIAANNPLTVPISLGVLANDTDPENDPLSAIQGSGPFNGTLTLNANGSFTYVPNADFLGVDSFTYQASDGINQVTATASITVGGANAAPIVVVPGGQATFRDTSLVIASGINVSDPDAGSSNLLAVTLTATNGALTLGSTDNLSELTGNGSNTVTFQGSVAAINAALINLVYQPDLDYVGSDQIAIAVNDQGKTGTGGAQIGTGNIVINVSTGASLLRDINPIQEVVGTVTVYASSAPTNLAAAGSALFFAANDGVNGVELWRSDGTTLGTKPVADLNGGDGNSSPANMTVVGSTLYFTASNGTLGTELWQTDLSGSLPPTLVRDIRLGSGSSTPSNLVNFNGTLFFRANDGSGVVVWQTDGTAGGTRKVGTGYTSAGNLTIVGNALYFTTSNGQQLWKTDGTDGGTVLVSNLGTTANITSLTAIANSLFFVATDSNGSELWRSDGTSGGTSRMTDLNVGSGSSNPNNLVNLGGTLYFFASDGTTSALYKSTAAGAVSKVSNLPSTAQLPASLTMVGSSLFYVVDVGTAGNPKLQLWQSNGSTVSLVKDINPTGNANISSLTNVNGTLFFIANDGTTRIWRSDGTDSGTVPVGSSFAGPVPTNLTAVGNRLYFTADTGTSGVELWIL